MTIRPLTVKTKLPGGSAVHTSLENVIFSQPLLFEDMKLISNLLAFLPLPLVSYSL